MSNIQFLLEQYHKAPNVQQLVAELKQGAPQCQLNGLMGAQRAFVLAATVRHLPTTQHLVIVESKEEAAYLLDDLGGLLGAEVVCFFPDSFKSPAYFEDLNPTQVLQRSEAVSKITTAGSPVRMLVTYPEALFEKVVSPNILAENRITVAAGERLDIDFVMEVLIEYGFERADFVYEPGQFSLRGGIIDLFSYGNDLPYRIELFDDEVESIRTFDPLTQLSQQKIASVNIIPNLNTRFRHDQKVSLFRILAERTVIWIKDFQFLLDRLQFCFERADQFAQKISALDAAEVREIFRDRAFVYPGDVAEDIGERQIVYLEKQTRAAVGLLN